MAGELDRRTLLKAAVASLLSLKIRADEPPKAGNYQVVRRQTEPEALTVALADASSPANLPGDWLYIWDPQTTPERRAAITFVWNSTVSNTARLPVTPRELDGGRLLAFSRSRSAPKEADFLRIFAVYERLAERDWFFHDPNQKVKAANQNGRLVVTIGETPLVVGKSILGAVGAGVRLSVIEEQGDWICVLHAGKKGWIKRSAARAIEVATVVPYAGYGRVGELMQQLATITQSQAPILRAETFVRYAYTTHLGFYYDWFDFRGKTLDDALQSMGSSVQAFDKTESRSAVAWSGITEGPRGVSMINVDASLAGAAMPNAFLTDDVDSQNLDPTKSAIYNLYSRIVAKKADGGEGIGVLPNGFPLFFIWNGQQQLAELVAQTIATDSTDLTTHKELRPGISCLRCHQDGFLKFLPNDVLWLQKNGGGWANIIGDAEQFGKDPQEVWDEIAGKYGHDLNFRLNQWRQAMDLHVHRHCGQPAEKIIAGVTGLYNSYEYGQYTPERVLDALGYLIRGEASPLEIRLLFNQVCPEIEDIRVDPHISMLREWNPDSPHSPKIGVRQFETVYSQLALRREKAEADGLALTMLDES
jgi:hypothetical protein